MTTDLIITQENSINYSSPKVLQTIRDTVAVGATESEFAMFVQVCKSTGLNPFKREVWFIKAGGRVQMMTGINGFYAIANKSPLYDGIEVGLVGRNGEYLPMTYPGSDFIGAWAKVHRKDRKIPSEGVAMLSEYDKGQGNWKSMRRIMISKCAESIALRKAFPQELNGLYTQEEMPVEYSGSKQVETVATHQPKQAPKPTPKPSEPEVVFDSSDDLPEEWFAEARHVASEEEEGGDGPSQVAFSMDDVEDEPRVWVLNIPYKLSQDETFKRSRRGKLSWHAETKRWSYWGRSLPTLESSSGPVDLLQYVEGV